MDSSLTTDSNGWTLPGPSRMAMGKVAVKPLTPLSHLSLILNLFYLALLFAAL